MHQKRILPPVYFLGCIIVMVLLHYGLPLVQLIPSPWNWLGCVALVVGFVIGVIAVAQFHREQTTVKPFQQSNALVTTGVYRCSRNPMYLGLVLMLIGLALLLGSLTPFVLIVVFVLIMNQVFIKTEERMLQETFGEEYEVYQRQVRRWI